MDGKKLYNIYLFYICDKYIEVKKKFENTLSCSKVGWIFTSAVIVILCLPLLFMDGMFMDAMLYTSVAHNLSKGIGTFWFPQFSTHNVGGLSSFHEHPPLGFGIQAVFFKIFGSSRYVERFYVLFTLILSAYGIHLVWNSVVRNFFPALEKISCLPAVFWVFMPLTFWSFSNNMLENTLTVFTLLAVYFYIQSFRSSTHKWIFLILATSATSAAFLTKGFPGLFPLSVAFWYFIFFERHSWKKFLVYYIYIFIILIFYIAALYFYDPARKALSIYLFKRVFYRILSLPTTDSWWFTAYRLFLELIPPILLALILYFFLRKKYSFRMEKKLISVFLFFLSVGVSASFPLMFTLVQKGFYMVPSFPYFAMAMGVVVGNPIINFMNELRNPTLRIIQNASLILLGTGLLITLLLSGQYKRDKELLEDVYALTKYLPNHSVIGISDAHWNEWSLQCYLARFGHISVESGFAKKYFLHFKEDTIPIPSEFRPINLPLHKFVLYEKINFAKGK